MNRMLFLVSMATIINQAYTNNYEWAHKKCASMTLREKIGQLLMVPITTSPAMQEERYAKELIASPYNVQYDYITSLIHNYHIGGIIYLFGNDPERAASLTNHFQSISNTPLLVGVDAEWGLPMRFYNTPYFAKAMTLGALHDTNLIYKVGKAIGEQCRSLGIHLNFAPVADVNTNPENPIINVRSFGQDPEKVATYCAAYMHGLHDAGIIACAKHFPGHGDAVSDSHKTLPTICKSKEELMETDLLPFKYLINEGINAIMMGHLKVPALTKKATVAASLSDIIVTDLLRKKLHFNGLAITDALGMQAITRSFKPGHAELAAFLAGNDILLCPTDVPKAIELIENAILEDPNLAASLDERVLKILKVKQDFVLPQQAPLAYEKAQTILQDPSSNEIKNTIFNQAITKVCDTEHLLPITQNYQDWAVLHVGGTLPSTFGSLLQKAPIDVFYCTPIIEKSTETFLLDKLQNKRAVIVACCDIVNNSQQNFGLHESLFKLLEELKKDKSLLFVLFGNPLSLMTLPKENNILVAYEQEPEAQEAAAKVILGKQQPNGTLPIAFPIT